MATRKYPKGRPGNATLGRKIKARRQGLPLSRAAAVMRAGIGLETWSNVEQGRIFPRIDTLIRIAYALECSVEELLPPYEMIMEPRA